MLSMEFKLKCDTPKEANTALRLVAVIMLGIAFTASLVAWIVLL